MSITNSISAVVIGAQRYDIEGNKMGKIILQHRPEFDNPDQIGFETMDLSCEYEFLDKLRKFDKDLPLEMQIQTIFRRGPRGKMGMFCIDAQPVKNMTPSSAASDKK